MEFGHDEVARVDVAFLQGPSSGKYHEPTPQITKEKQAFGDDRSARWFGL
ncbi:MAG: hypothetical protein Kow002_06050 [Anaerolineales bacterium]